LHVKICFIRVKSAGHRTLSVPGRTSADVIIYRRRPAPVRYVTTQEKILKNRPVPGRLSNSPVMCKSLKSYDVSFICDHSITCITILNLSKSMSSNNTRTLGMLHFFLYFAVLRTKILMQLKSVSYIYIQI